MIKIKSQKITPNISPESHQASFVISSQDTTDVKQNWDYYAVFDFSSSEPLSIQVAINIVTDVFSHTLILGPEAAVLQVLERSLKESREALHKIREDLSFNAVVAVFKDDQVYISIYGSSKALYLDGTQIVHVDTEKEGNYASAIQKVEDGKVIVLCTHSFFSKFPPKSLVSLAKPILAQDLDDSSSAVIIKVDKDPAIVPEAEFNPAESVPNPPQISLKTSQSVVKESVSYISPKNKRNTRKVGRIKIIVFAVIAVLLGALLIWVFRDVISKPQAPQPVTQDVITEEDQPLNEGVVKEPVPEVQGELTKKLDEANRVKRVDAQVFYDISITDSKTSPTELAAGSNYLAVSDSGQGKIYVSSKTVTKFSELPQLFPGVKNLLFEGDTLVFTDNEGVKFYNLETKSVSQSYLVDPAFPILGAASEYSGFTYALAADNLVKFSKMGNKLSGTLWLQKPEFSNVVSVDIDGSIYTLFSNGNLEKYTSGNKDDFSIVGLDKPIQKPLKVVTDAEFDNIYVADGTEGRVVVFDTDGVLEYQIKPQPGNEWSSLKSFDVSTNEKKFYVLSGTKVFEFSL